MIHVSELSFSFSGRPPVLSGINLAIPRGIHVAVMGPNGSGKSTLALLLKGLLFPSGGRILVDGVDAVAGEAGRTEVMRRVGLVFQNPENAIVATTVEREIAFGLENLGVPGAEMHRRVDDALRRFGLEELRYASPGRLSGGEKQRLALAGVMSMRPDYLVLDEPTSLLDPENGGHILDLVREAAADGGTVIHITQFAAEALAADRLIVLDRGAVVLDGSPRDVLREAGAFGVEDLDDAAGTVPGRGADTGPYGLLPDRESPVVFRGISCTYDRGTPFAHRALEDADAEFPRGSATVLLGPSGSGKTTFLEILAGITPPTTGEVVLRDAPLRAMAFQFPEDQVFGDTVGEYAAFGPGNIGMTPENAERSVDDSLAAVGLDPAVYRNRDPFTLSGGEKRRAALAGVLAMRPDVLVLDEPTAGLDRAAADRVVQFLTSYTGSGGTLIFSTHDFRIARRLAQRAVVLRNGRIETVGSLETVFGSSPWLKIIRNRRAAAPE